MEFGNYGKKIDIFMTLLIAYFFIICISFQYIQSQNIFENYIMLLVLMFVALISYYTDMTFSLIVVLICDFAYFSYKLYMSVTNSISINENSYYWAVSIPLTALIVSFLSRYILYIQMESKKIMAENKSFVMIDPLTGIRNSSALLNELPIYMNMSKRHGIPLSLMVVKFKYNSNLKSIAGMEFFRDILVKCSRSLENSLRIEDRKYILPEDDIFAFILISDENGCEIIKTRLKENINNMTLDRYDRLGNLKLEVQIGYYIYNEDIQNPMDFLSKAEKELDYDI
ncbi:MAG: GGDEF domain-containing protein [Clostridium sp.]|jgi:GGDEF domain-containing protein|uniref:GGDEF domain-containing protein n=1 Tax=Clostridium sp. TaxID=1506 RepID=UPI0025C4BA00|nr:GGDEF domain-containing protein [Clostridium sp.]MCH3964838.1 GGDEF domain-containing protein [Clostridium sp.]MCI1716667.1 GGDEF domain-containing protein [Clostridium sp.]MCI1800851.1 GGDEF domain-containing protein [Clostridium sp.]MCI1814844.1 GGDEF domain-containing protein [Clostridium sp.]MCI1871598.1 GGDEF domain-containing protein [Clostridium sp.]